MEQRPGQRVGRPGIVVGPARHDREQRARAAEVDTGAHTVAAPRRGAEPVREPLGQPALDALRRHHDHLGRERIGQRRRQQLAELVGELVGARGAVEVEGHCGPTLVVGYDESGGR